MIKVNKAKSFLLIASLLSFGGGARQGMVSIRTFLVKASFLIGPSECAR